jgi:DNA-binding IscR family transcriptional regulator
MADKDAGGATWTFFSNHTHVLVCLAADGDQTVRDIAQKVGITERAVLRIVSELEQGGVLARERDGRRNRYTIDAEAPLRHPLEAHCRIGDVLALVTPKATTTLTASGQRRLGKADSARGLAVDTADSESP